MQVLDLMTTDVLAVTPETDLKAAAEVMVRNRVSGLPVVTGPERRLVGMITEADFLRLEVEHGPEHTMSGAQMVGDVMSADVVTTGPEALLAEAAEVMVVEDIKRLPVIDGDGCIMGIISRFDIMAAFTRPDEVIEDEIREDVIRRALFADPATVDVRVAGGHVVLRGELSTRGEVALLTEVVRRLDGVMSVDSEMSWRDDSS